VAVILVSEMVTTKMTRSSPASAKECQCDGRYARLCRGPASTLTVLAVILVVAFGVIPAQAAPPVPADAAPSARELLQAAIDQNRGENSYVEMTMVVHRPAWERTSRLKSWTRGREDALIRFVAPAKDAGNATLKLGNKMWTFTPKLNRTIRLPYSMMSRSWGGSDFSYTDLSRSDNWLDDYELSVASTGEVDGHRHYTINAIPNDDAAVVWGKEEIVLRDDHVIVSHTFFDQDMIALRRLKTLAIEDRDGRAIPTHQRMENLDGEDKFTEILWGESDFDLDVPDRMFTLFHLKAGE
jgi:hypothetical protein